MATQECFVCETCKKHGKMEGSSYGQAGLIQRLTQGWFAKKVTPAVDIAEVIFFCGVGCVWAYEEKNYK